MAAVTSRFVYVSRRRTDIIDRVMTGEFLSLQLTQQDSPERPVKLPSYILTRFPVSVDPNLTKEVPGVCSAHRFYNNGSPVAVPLSAGAFSLQPQQKKCADAAITDVTLFSLYFNYIIMYFIYSLFMFFLLCILLFILLRCI